MHPKNCSLIKTGHRVPSLNKSICSFLRNPQSMNQAHQAASGQEKYNRTADENDTNLLKARTTVFKCEVSG